MSGLKRHGKGMAEGFEYRHLFRGLLHVRGHDLNSPTIAKL